MERKWIKRILYGLLSLLLLATAGFIIWAETPLGPMPEALSALQNNNQVKVETDPWLTFTPTGKTPRTGFIFYPGGRVDAHSYAPAAQQITSAGYLVVIPPMPLNLAFLAPNRASEVIETHPEIEYWVIGGHSLGGAMAARFAYQHPGQIDGLVLWASYPADDNSLAESKMPVLSIYGSEDMGREGIEARKELLPPQTQWVFIPCANHAQMGWYGPQPGDGEACITRQEQQTIVIEATLSFLQQIETQGD